ncbi:uncharacterized protein LOC133192976 [Saccostrea echinata]|uniref:uncharacterized protein LOC133192976 n=1 Tax=Saccostrea echinata TaxID=191078 RepID=UPI002A811B94|nr:uncharacterized protein LOC133192976 [Saccostrea echinata]
MRVSKSKECIQVLFSITLSILGVAAKPRCDPEDNMYYHQQADQCFRCDRCYKGEEPIPLESWEFNGNGETGPTECRPCRKCRPGMFSDTRSFACKPCKNCTLYNQYETGQCTNERNTICDGVKPTTPYRPNSEPESSPDKTGSSQGEHTSTENQSSGQINITIPSQESSDDSQPLLQQISFNNQSVAHSSIELEESGPLEIDSILTNNSQESIDGPLSLSDEHRPPTAAGNLIRFENHDKRNSAALSTDGSTDSEADQEVMEMNQVTDGASNSFSRKIKYDRQWSYPFDEKGERDYKSTASKSNSMAVSEKVSKDDLSIGIKNRKENKVLEEKFLRSISKHLVKDRMYIHIARECGLEEADVDIVKIDNQHESVQEASYQMLRRLVMKCRTTQAVFIKAVRKHDQLALEKVFQCL